MRAQINNPVSSSGTEQFNEFSGLRSPREADSPNRQHLKHQNNSENLNQALMAARQLISTLNRLRIRSSPSIVGGLWQSPKELDPTVAVAADTLVYISPLNPLCTTGLVDLDSSGATLKATAGTWLCLIDVPAATGSGYNVPQDPPPGSGVAVPSGSPLRGDLDATDAPKVYWLLLKSVC